MQKRNWDELYCSFHQYSIWIHCKSCRLWLWSKASWEQICRALQCKWGFCPCKILFPGRCYMDTQHPPRSRNITGTNDIKYQVCPCTCLNFCLSHSVFWSNSSPTGSLNWAGPSWVHTPLCFLDIATLTSSQTLSLQWGIIVWNYQIKKGTM